MNEVDLLAGRLPESLTVTVTHAQLRSGFPGWNRTELAPSFNRLYFIAEGEGSVIINGETYYPRPGQLMIMPAGTSQTTYTNPDDPYTRYFCHFDAQVGEWPLFHAGSKLYISDAGNPEYVRATFDEMIRQFQSGGPFAGLRMQACLLNLLACCLEEGGYRDYLKDYMQFTERNKLSCVLKYIQEHLYGPIEIETLADIVHLHPNYFIPYFKKIMGVTPMHYVQRKRMEEAKRLLTFTDDSIADIAERLGMQLAHFSRQFKSHAGISPTVYRACTR
ncbi:AraC family transcriptional regulator [Paenibacillus sp. MBLB2552]|uniref:AraC family transcriptional regulator n=1 Tax=Paenibacillus mellifer TaxID=2937794 RepID=A0A9X1XU84_9BACL|nr:AraC family transcriptional regulator [Paenibacillus mellifer]MCK8485670.1 AraC family transcriptional regulator [Paenibacillus mellifer]